jgi:large subunit ribosomal protein L1
MGITVETRLKERHGKIDKRGCFKIEKNKLYSLKDAAALIKVVASAKFDESVDIAVRFV